jgi:hypothetical protein
MMLGSRGGIATAAGTTFASEPAPEAGAAYFPPPESKGGWRTLQTPDDVRRLAGMDAEKLAALRVWLLASDKRDFAAVVVRCGYIVLEVERNKSSRTDAQNIKSCAKAVCAMVLAIASQESQEGRTPRRMTFDDPAVPVHPLGPAAERPAEGQDHRQATAEPHVGPRPGIDRRPQRRAVGVHHGPQRRP